MTDASATSLPTELPALGAHLPKGTGPVTLSYDAGLEPTVDMRNGSAVPEIVHSQLRQRIQLVETALPPAWTVERLVARIQPGSGAPHALNPTQLRSRMDGFADAGRALPEAVRDQLRMHAAVTAHVGADHVEAEFNAHEIATPECADACGDLLQIYTGLAATSWALIARNVLGAWILDSGITELRLRGDLTPRSREVH